MTAPRHDGAGWANLRHPSSYMVHLRSVADSLKKVEVRGIPHLAKHEPAAPNFLFAALS